MVRTDPGALSENLLSHESTEGAIRPASALLRSEQMVRLRSRLVRRSSFATGRLGAARRTTMPSRLAALRADQHG